MPVDSIDDVAKGLRGIYVLYNYRPKLDMHDVVYVGMAVTGGIRARLRKHRKKKSGLWTHCSIYEVWDNISSDEVEELEGLFRHIYRKDSKANKLNKQKGFGKLKAIKNRNISKW